MLIWSGAVKDGSLLGWSDLVAWCDGGGLIWWADFGGLVWRWSGVVVGAWSDLWSDLRLVWLSDVMVWPGADLMGCWCGLVPWPNLKVWLRRIVWRLKIKKMRNWGNSSDKALTPSESYVQRNEEKIRKYFIFQIQLQLKTPIPWKSLKRLNETNTGLCWRSFQIFSSFCVPGFKREI